MITGLARAVLAGTLLFALIGSVLMISDAWQIRSALQAAHASMGEVRRALGDVDLARAASALEDADEQLATARSRSSGVIWSTASYLPVVRHSTRTIREVVEVASAAVDLGRVAVHDGGEVLERGLDVEVEDGRVDLAPLLAARDLVDGLPVERLVLAHDRLDAPRSGWIPEVLQDGRAETLVLADDTIATVTRARDVTTALPGFLGADGPRRYFVGMQTSAHLRGTGGMIGFWGVLQVDDGEFTFGQTDVYDVFDETAGPEGEPAVARVGALGGPTDGGVDADPAFLDRYGRLAANSSFAQVNLDPDLPTVARVGLDLFELRTGQQLDGMIVLDPIGVQELLAVTGPTLPLTPDLASLLELDNDLETDRFAELATAGIYENLGSGRSADRKDALRGLGDLAFAQVLQGGWDGAAMARAVITSTSGRHLQVYSMDDAEQQAFTDIGAVGSLSSPDGIDLLAVTANNTGGGKQDVHVGHAFEATIELSDFRQSEDGAFSARRSMTVETDVDNPLPTSGMDEYIIGNCVREDEVNRCFEGPPGWNWTWFSVWLPEETEVVAARTDSDDRVSGLGEFRGFTVVDQYQGTPPEGQGGFGLDVVGRVPVRVEGEALVYEFGWWRQAKAIPDLLNIEVHAPDGWTIHEVQSTGGGDGRGMGVHGDGVDLQTTTDGRVAHLSGTVTADTRLQVHLTAGTR